jgi:hypothetical protein
MPGLDRTGPAGKGSRTGRALGLCRKANQDSHQDEETTAAQFERGGMARRFGRGRGKGTGRGRRFSQ